VSLLTVSPDERARHLPELLTFGRLVRDVFISLTVVVVVHKR
jgi:hypothetical protein